MCWWPAFDVERAVPGVESLGDEYLRFIAFHHAKIFPCPPHIDPRCCVELEDREAQAQGEIHPLLSCRIPLLVHR